jgi:hypothetical protein
MTSGRFTCRTCPNGRRRSTSGQRVIGGLAAPSGRKREGYDPPLSPQTRGKLLFVLFR